MSERVYKLGRGPWHQYLIGFGVRPGCQIAQISFEQWGAAIGDEVAARVEGGFPLPMGMHRKGGQM